MATLVLFTKRSKDKMLILMHRNINGLYVWLVSPKYMKRLKSYGEKSYYCWITPRTLIIRSWLIYLYNMFHENIKIMHVALLKCVSIHPILYFTHGKKLGNTLNNFK